MEFNRNKLNRAIVLLFHHTLAMEPSSRIRISPENRRRLRQDKEAFEQLIEFASAAMNVEFAEDQLVSAKRKPLHVSPADVNPIH